MPRPVPVGCWSLCFLSLCQELVEAERILLCVLLKLDRPISDRSLVGTREAPIRLEPEEIYNTQLETHTHSNSSHTHILYMYKTIPARDHNYSQRYIHVSSHKPLPSTALVSLVKSPLSLLLLAPHLLVLMSFSRSSPYRSLSRFLLGLYILSAAPPPALHGLS